MRRALLLLLLALAGCSDPQLATAVDKCVLQEYLEECEYELLTPEEQQACKVKAPREATRLLAGIPATCR